MSSIEHGVVLPEQYTYIEELLMKYQLASAGGQYAIFPVVQDARAGAIGPDVLNPYFDAIEFWAKLFRWNRGAIRFKILQTPATPAELLVDPNRRFGTIAVLPTETVLSDTGLETWSFASDLQQRAVVEAEIVHSYASHANSYWTYGCPLDVTPNTFPYEVIMIQGSGLVQPVDATIWRAVGDDFMLGHQLAVPFLHLTALPKDSKGKEKSKSQSAPTLDQSVGREAFTKKVIEALSAIKR